MVMRTEFDQLREFLKEMFQFEDHDLDFGIYRIIRLKRRFIEGFINGEGEDSLRATVERALKGGHNQKWESARNTLHGLALKFGILGQEAWDAFENAPTNEDNLKKFSALVDNPLVSEEKRKEAEDCLKIFLETRRLSTAELAVRVYNHLLNFFELYFQNGDFGYNNRAASAFKVPYEADYDGSDTLFHWKHKDSYYIKTGNGFHTVRCEVGGKWLEFQLCGGDEEAHTDERNNVKENRIKHYRLVDITPEEETDPAGGKRTVWQVRFSLATASTPKTEIYTRLWRTVFGAEQDLIAYLYKSLAKGEEPPGKPVFNDLADDYDKTDGGSVKGVGQLRLKFDKYTEELAKRDEFKELGKNAGERLEALARDETVLTLWQIDRNLNKFYVGNDADYFIHKDLKGFLTREKARFIKQVIFSDLDALLNAGEDNATSLIARAFNAVADTVIGFLAAIEDFQKGLFELKKKVVDTHYLVSVGKIPTDFHQRVFACEAQIIEWREMFKVDITEAAQLADHPTLVVDTSLYQDTDPNFQDDLLSLPEFDDLDAQTDGVLINSENWQALNLLQEKFRERIKCIYIDPPYNTGGDGFLYKDSFRHSSWASMLHDRLQLAHPLLSKSGVLFSSIDNKERTQLENLCQHTFGQENRVEELIWAQNTNDNRAPAYSTNHEYVLVYAKNKALATSIPRMFRETRPGYAEIMGVLENMQADYPDPESVENAIKDLMNDHRRSFKQEMESLGLGYNRDTQKQDPWRGIYNYRRVEYRDAEGRFVPKEEARAKQALLWVWREADASAPPKEDARKISDPQDPNYRFYRPIHPITGKPCPHPNGGWRLRYAPDPDDPAKDSFLGRQQDHRIVWGEDEKKIPQLKRFLHEVGTSNGNDEDGGLVVPKSVFHDYTDGTKQFEELFGEKGVFRFPKPTTLMSRFFEQTTEAGDWVADFFVGSGTSAHALLRLNKDYGQEQARRFLVVEMGQYADTIVKERIKKVMFSVAWKAGKPLNRNGLRHVIKVSRLEQYEDLLDNLSVVWDDDSLPSRIPVQYLFRPDQHAISSSLDLSRPFAQTLRVGKTREEKTIDLMETWCYLQGYWVKSRRLYREFDRPYLAVETTHGTLVVFRDIEDAEDDTENLKAILAKYGEGSGAGAIRCLEVNHDADLRRLPVETIVISAADFMRGAQWN